jgi:hypothetical protein
MGEITFLPWLGLGHGTRVAGVTLLPWEQFRQSGDLPDDEREWLTKYLRGYRKRDGTTPVDTVTVVRAADGGVAGAYRTIRAAAAACLVWEHAWALSRGNPTMLPPRGERWLVFTQRFDPVDTTVALREGYTANVWPLDSFVEVEPLSPGETVQGLEPPVIGMAETLVGQGQQDEELGAALDLLVEGAMTSARHLTRLNFVFLGAAFELLAQAGGSGPKATRIGAALAEAVRKARNGCPTAENALYRAASRARRASPDLAQVWMGGCDLCNQGSCTRHRNRYVGFYRRRNKIIHEGRAGGDLLFHQRPDTGDPHRWQIQVGGGGAHACDVALVMAGWLLLDRVSGSLAYDSWNRWCHALDRAAEASGMAEAQGSGEGS